MVREKAQTHVRDPSAFDAPIGGQRGLLRERRCDVRRSAEVRDAERLRGREVRDGVGEVGNGEKGDKGGEVGFKEMVRSSG